MTQCMVLADNRADLHQLSCYGTANNLAPVTLLLLLFVCLTACAYCPALISTSSITETLVFLGPLLTLLDVVYTEISKGLLQVPRTSG